MPKKAPYINSVGIPRCVEQALMKNHSGKRPGGGTGPDTHDRQLHGDEHRFSEFSGPLRHHRYPAMEKFRMGLKATRLVRKSPQSSDKGSPLQSSKGLTIVVIDDQSTGRLLITEILQNVDPDAQVVSFGDPVEALAYAENNRIDLVMTDYRMPGIDGVETIRRLRALSHMADVPIICVTIVDERDVKYQALAAGATDFLKRPLDPFECAARCRNLLSLRRHQLLNQKYTEDLELRIDQVTQEMRVSEMETLLRLARVAEQRDSFTGLHLVRMAKYSALLARECKWSIEGQNILELAAPLHDIGKISIPDAILQARRRLSEEEMSVMRNHAQIGYTMLHGSQSRYLQMAASVAQGHHERFDGTGYPSGIAGHDIPLEARIVAIADVYDALTSKRHYKEAWSVAETREYMLSLGGQHFDPELLEKFLACAVELEQIRLSFADPISECD